MSNCGDKGWLIWSLADQFHDSLKCAKHPTGILPPPRQVDARAAGAIHFLAPKQTWVAPSAVRPGAVVLLPADLLRFGLESVREGDT